jgi:type I restriction enzyme S subunit
MITETKNTKAFYNTEIPSDWEVCSLGSLADKKKKWSFTGGPFGSNLKAEDYTETGIRIIQLQNIGDGEFLNNYKIFTSPKKADELLSCNIYPGEIILSKMGDPVARGCFIPNEDKRYLMASDGIRVLPDSERVDSFFLLSFINYSIFRTEAIKISTGSTRQRIGLDDLKSIKIPLPPLPEQKAIAQVLSTADAAIHTTEKLIAQKELRKKWLMQQLLTGKKRLKGFENTKWKIQPLENFIKPIVREIPKPSTSYLGIGLRSHGKGTFLKLDEKPEKNSMDNFYVVRPNDLIVNITFAWEQAIAIVRPEDDGALASHRFPTYTFIEDKGHPDFFRFYILQPRMKFMLQMISPGGAGRNRVMSKSDFIKLEFLLPDYKEQTAIAQVLQAADKEISLLKAKVEKLREQKKGLMQVLLTGKKRLNQDFQDSGMDRIKNTEAIKSSKS